MSISSVSTYFVQFEDLLTDLKAKISTLSEFFTIELSEEQVNLIAKFCRFERMNDVLKRRNVDWMGRSDQYKSIFNPLQRKKLDLLIVTKNTRHHGLEAVATDKHSMEKLNTNATDKHSTEKLNTNFSSPQCREEHNLGNKF